jgi:hypothetical protein
LPKKVAADATRSGVWLGRAILLGMLLARFDRVIGRMAHLSMCHMSMMPGRLRVAGFVLGGSFLVVMSGRVAATRCGPMKLCGLRFTRHVVFLCIFATDYR